MNIEIFNTKIKPVADKMLKSAAITPKPAQAEVYFSELAALNWQLDDNGDVIVLDEYGITKTDRHGWPLTITAAVTEVFDRFFEKSDLPETLEDLDKRLKNPAITAADRVRLVEHWLKLHPDSQYFSERSLHVQGASQLPKN